MRGRDPTLDAPVVVHGQTTTLAPFQQAGLLCGHACHDCDPRWLSDALWSRLASRPRRDAGHHRRLAGGAGHGVHGPNPLQRSMPFVRPRHESIPQNGVVPAWLS